MLRNTFLAVLTVLTVAAVSQAAVTITANAGIDTPGLAGYKTFTLTAASDGAPLQGFDFVGDPTATVDPATSRGFFGPMNQVALTGGLSTVWTDSDALIPVLSTPAGASAQADSNFLFASSALLIIPGSARETATSLQGAFSTSADFGQSVAIAELVIPTAASGRVDFRGVVGTTDGAEFPVSGFVDTGGGGGDPPVIAPVNLGEVEQSTTIMADLAASNGPIVWSALTPTAGTPAIAATLTEAGAFSWNPAGSARGPKGTGVAYSWTATATGPGGAATGVAISLSLIPEPATLSMLGLAIVGLLGFRKRS
jgi:hypothetical protein